MKPANWIATLAMVAMAAATAVGAEVGSPDSRVRAASAEARELLVNAVTKSPTVTNLVGEIELSDIVVVIEFRQLPKRVNGLVQVVTATASVRYLRLALNVPNGRNELMALLGHELRHVVEIAGMPGVRDDASLAEAYRKAGASMLRDGYFETEAALETGRAVAREMKARR
jgi:hypothetical protein